LQEKLGRTATKKSDASSAKKSSLEDAPKQVEVKFEKKTVAEEIVELLTKRYRRNLHLFEEWDNDDVMQAYLTSLANVYDPHSDYFNKSQADNFAIGMNLQLFGIGAELWSDEGYCTIRRLTPNGPAEKSNKIKAKDRIVAVAQSNAPPVDVVDMSLNKVVQLIRGPKGTEVRLTIIPAEDNSERRVLALIRDEIKLEDNEAKAKVIEVSAAEGKTLRLAVIDVPSFYAPIDFGGPRPGLGESGKAQRIPTTSGDVARLLGKLKNEGIDGIILDLRRNGGGSLEEAIKLTGLFIKEGPVVQAQAPDNSVVVHEDDDPRVLYEGPLIVLTSRFSASASEILAGALQDYGRALIVGDSSTHGKGTVQNLNPLRAFIKPASISSTDDPGQLKTTIRMFFRPGGSSTQLKGVMSDIVLPSVWNHSKDIGEKALENPLPWDTVRAAKYDKLDLIEPYLPELMRRSRDRVATNQDFAYIQEDIELFRKAQADRTISLNEAERLKEKEEIEARQKVREKERLARKEPDQKIYELALRQVDLPGLKLVEKTNSAARSLAAKGATSAASTNSASVAAKAVTNTDADDDEEAAIAVDATLEEAEKILEDYIRLLSQKGLASSSR